MALDAKKLASEMQRSVAGFSPSAEYVKYGLTYLLINNFGRFICGSALAGSWDQVTSAIVFLDSLVMREDPEVEKLVGDCIEGLLDCSAFDQVKTLFGERLKNMSARYTSA
jgi:hypothetical protein